MVSNEPSLFHSSEDQSRSRISIHPEGHAPEGWMSHGIQLTNAVIHPRNFSPPAPVAKIVRAPTVPRNTVPMTEIVRGRTRAACVAPPPAVELCDVLSRALPPQRPAVPNDHMVHGMHSHFPRAAPIHVHVNLAENRLLRGMVSLIGTRRPVSPLTPNDLPVIMPRFAMSRRTFQLDYVKTISSKK